MDNLTHALAGCLIGAAVAGVSQPSSVNGKPQLPAGFRRTSTIVGIVAAELPDIDLLYAGPVLGMGKLGYLLHHRGHTHTVAFALAGALLVWFAALGVTRQLIRPFTPASLTSRASVRLAVVAFLGTASHLLLDYTNSYGIHPFWPLNNRWYYGDSVFIVEPWFWIVSIPALFFTAKGRFVRVLLVATLALALVAAWTVSIVGREVAIALSVGVVIWTVIVFPIHARARIVCAIAAWLTVELIFVASSGAASRMVKSNLGSDAIRDVVLSPAVSNPLCFHVIVVRSDDVLYRVTEGTVAPVPRLRTAWSCDGVSKSQQGQSENLPVQVSLDESPQTSRIPSTESNKGVRWTREWSAPLVELRRLASSNCEFAAALRFIRVPEWRFTRGGTELSDARFGSGSGFATIETRAGSAMCERYLPPWQPPRTDILGRTGTGTGTSSHARELVFISMR